jgi:hypothetical protein
VLLKENTTGLKVSGVYYSRVGPKDPALVRFLIIKKKKKRSFKKENKKDINFVELKASFLRLLLECSTTIGTSDMYFVIEFIKRACNLLGVLCTHPVCITNLLFLNKILLLIKKHGIQNTIDNGLKLQTTPLITNTS